MALFSAQHYVYIGWLSCAFCLLFAIYGPWIMDPSAPTPWYGTFMVIASVLWATGIAWIVYACVSGCGAEEYHRLEVSALMSDSGEYDFAGPEWHCAAKHGRRRDVVFGSVCRAHHVNGTLVIPL
ncbi:hypothetical protein HPB48_001006 [Haemaphysalis longicornis]|uniref:Uncharacterized protein n=1 Tax=Haemaphysalis longicornis TaxID=44386 RepID=A0A9J6GWJ6_HAELO|nr:hypothetical protein HPB48_001006 [Haemaphysalis longicornis]